MAVWTVIAGALAAIPALLKKKRFVLWYEGMDAIWRKKSTPISYRQCRKTRTALVALGKYQIERFAILRDGTST